MSDWLSLDVKQVEERLNTVLISWEKNFLSSTVLSDICYCKMLVLHAVAVLSCNSLAGGREPCLKSLSFDFSTFGALLLNMVFI